MLFAGSMMSLTVRALKFKSGTPPCKSGQLEKDLGLEVSSARHAAPLIIFEIMRSFFVSFKCSTRSLTFWIWGAGSSNNQSSMRRFHADSHFIFLDSVKAIMVHCAHRLLSGLNRILCTLRTHPCARASRSRRLRHRKRGSE